MVASPLFSLNRSERCRIRNLLCQEICWLEHSGALDPGNPPAGYTKRQIKMNVRCVGYDRSALARIVPNPEQVIEKYRLGPFARRLRIVERQRERKIRREFQVKVLFEKIADKAAWQVVKK